MVDRYSVLFCVSPENHLEEGQERAALQDVDSSIYIYKHHKDAHPGSSVYMAQT